MEKEANPFVYMVDLKGIVDYRTDIGKPSHQEHIRRLQAGRPAATLFTFASLQALIQKYGKNTTVQDALAQESGKK